jgi:DNA repair protein RadC
MDECNASYSGAFASAKALHPRRSTDGLWDDDRDMVLSNDYSVGGRDMEAPDQAEDIRDRQALEQLLRVVVHDDARVIASSLLDTHRSLSGVFSAFQRESCSEPIGHLIKSVRNVIYQSLKSEVSRAPVFSTKESVIDYLTFVMSHLKVEEVRVLFLNATNRLIRDDVICRGTVNEAPVYPREIIKRALDYGATAIILAHNHPSGDPTPSPSDVEATDRLRLAGRELGITLHDHIIVARQGWFSLRIGGML